jgi:hypothetical protein
MERLRELDTPRRWLAIAVAALVLIIGYALLALRPATVEFINHAQAPVGYAQTEIVLLQIDDTFYLVGPPGAPDLSVSGRLSHHVGILTQGCDELGSLDVAAGEFVGVTLNPDRSVTAGTGMLNWMTGTPVALASPPCPVAVPPEVVLRDIVLLVAVASGALGLVLLVRQRASHRT